jgi:hypothetical protein
MKNRKISGKFRAALSWITAVSLLLCLPWSLGGIARAQEEYSLTLTNIVSAYANSDNGDTLYDFSVEIGGYGHLTDYGLSISGLSAAEAAKRVINTDMISLKSGETATISGISANTSYDIYMIGSGYTAASVAGKIGTVTEDTSLLFWPAAAGGGASARTLAIRGGDAPIAAEVKLGGAPLSLSADYTVEITGVASAALSARVTDGKLQLLGGETAVIRNIPAGTAYSVGGVPGTLTENTLLVYGASGAYLDFAELDRAIAEAGGYTNATAYTAGSWSVFAAALTRAMETLANGTAQSAIDADTRALTGAIDGLRNAAVSEGTSPETFPNIGISLAAWGESAETGEYLYYDIAVSGAENLATLGLDFEYSGETLTFVRARGLEDFGVIAAADGALTLWNAKGLTAQTQTGVVRLTFLANAAGEARVSLRRSAAAAYRTDKTAAVDVGVNPGGVQSAMIEIRETAPITYDDLDFNRDGKLSLADLATAQLYYRVSRADAELWTSASAMDLDGNGLINVSDYIELLGRLNLVAD